MEGEREVYSVVQFNTSVAPCLVIVSLYLAESKLDEETRLKILIMAILQRSAAEPVNTYTNKITHLELNEMT